jgi:hypothetical protein
VLCSSSDTAISIYSTNTLLHAVNVAHALNSGNVELSHSRGSFRRRPLARLACRRGLATGLFGLGGGPGKLPWRQPRSPNLRIEEQQQSQQPQKSCPGAAILPFVVKRREKQFDQRRACAKCARLRMRFAGVRCSSREVQPATRPTECGVLKRLPRTLAVLAAFLIVVSLEDVPLSRECSAI